MNKDDIADFKNVLEDLTGEQARQAEALEGIAAGIEMLVGVQIDIAYSMRMLAMKAQADHPKIILMHDFVHPERAEAWLKPQKRAGAQPPKEG